ncbi:hypothetical protein DPMN_019242, partial [Dreissena polymorpha]
LCVQVTPLPQAARRKSTNFENLSVSTENTLSQLKQCQTYQEDRIKSLKVSYKEHERLIVDGLRVNIVSYLHECETSTVNTTHKHMQYPISEMREGIKYLLADFEKSTIKEKKEELNLKQTPLNVVRNSCIRLHYELFHLHVAIPRVLGKPELSFIASKKCLENMQQSDIFIKENFSNMQFVNKMATQSDRVFFFCCLSCMKNKNIEEYAVYYCEKCQQCFCRQCCELHHDYLFSEHVKYNRLNMRNWPVSKYLEAFILMCEIHTHKQLETFCKDHSQLCCSKCVSLSHRKCKIVTLNSAKKQAAEVQELFEKLLINMRKLRKLQSCCESGIQDLKSSYQGQERMVHKMNDKIKSTMAKIVRRTLKKIPKVEQNKNHELMHSTLFHIENITLNEAKITLSSLEDSLKTGVETCIRHHHELKALHELLLYSRDNNNENLCIIASRKCIDKIQQVESYLDENSVKLECSVLQQTIQGTEQYIVRLSGLGRLEESMKAHTDIEQYLSKLSGLVRVVGPNYVFTVRESLSTL